MATFKAAPLLDAYVIYQHLMDYWAETMQDDCYLISDAGWLAGALPREIRQVKNKEGKLVWPEKEYFKKGKRRFKSNLVPAALLIARYFGAERDAIAAGEAELAAFEQQLDESREEHSGEEGLLAEVIEGEGDKQKNTAKAVKVRLKEIGRDPDYAEERQALEAYAALLDQQANAKARLKTAQDDLEAKLDAQYPRLTEADMRRLLNTYVQADPAADVGNLNSLSLTELIIETGIHDAIARRLNEKGRLSKNAIAEGIINNVRKPIIRDQLTDPRFYGEISQLLEDLIKQSRADAVAYEEFLRKAEDLVKRLAREQPDPDIPAVLHGNHEATVIFNNLPHILAAGCGGAIVTAEPLSDYGGERVRLALEIDRMMRERAPAGWKGDQTSEAQVLNALFSLLGRDREATLALFAIINNLPGYR